MIALSPAALRRGLLLAALLACAAAPSRADDAPVPDAPAPAAADSAAAEPMAEPVADDSSDAGAAAPAFTPSDPGPPNAPLRSVRKVRLVGPAQHVARAGPGDTYAVIGVFAEKSAFPVIAKSGEWYGVQLSERETGWFHQSLCREFDDLSDLQYRPNPRRYTRTGTFVLQGYTGGYAFDQKSNSFVLGGKLGYYVFDRLQVDGGAAWTHVHRPAEIVESLFDLSLEAEDFHMLFYHLNATIELLPGRQMVPYVSGGVGSSILRGETEPSWNFGAGTTLFLSRRTAVRWEVRDYVFDSGTSNTRRTNHNIEFTIGSLWLF
jgi:outer membrane beta-barrel protein